MEPNSLREEPIETNQQDPFDNGFGRYDLYPPNSMKGSKNSQPDDPLGNRNSYVIAVLRHIILLLCMLLFYITVTSQPA